MIDSMDINQRGRAEVAPNTSNSSLCNVRVSGSTPDGGDGEQDRVLRVSGGGAALSIEGARESSVVGS